MSKSFERKLRALKYPGWAQFKSSSIDSVKELVFFLENEKIRGMVEGDRAKIKADRKTGVWYKEFSKYLENMETCPYRLPNNMSELTDSEWIEIIEWLVSQAILVDYEDNKADYNKNKPIRRIKKKSYLLTECETKECEEALLKLCNLLKVPNNRDNLITSEALYTLIACKFNSQAIGNYELGLKEKNDIKDKFENVKTFKDILNLYSHYEGFKTGDERVDAAAIILKILYILDVRGLQNQLNEIVTFIQRFTANPRTNTKLGKVGY